METSTIERLASKVANEILGKFKWKKVGPINQDFSCDNSSKHASPTKKQSHTHPVDVVYSYKDPYSGKTVYLNTDLKSYAKKSINKDNLKTALISLAQTIECARYSEQWQKRYVYNDYYEVKGLLFIYNYDNEFSRSISDFFYPSGENNKRRVDYINIEEIPLSYDQEIHILGPETITYMINVSEDLSRLISKNLFPKKDYGFYYPTLIFHKVSVSGETGAYSTVDHHAATVEVVSSPFMIIEHGETKDEDTGGIKSPKGYVIYYNRTGETDKEFFYLLDSLSNYQILTGKNKIRIRLCSKKLASEVISNFSRGLDMFFYEYALDENTKESIRKNIECDAIQSFVTKFDPEITSWSDE